MQNATAATGFLRNWSKLTGNAFAFGVSYLYWDVKSGYDEQIQQARKEIAVLNTKVDRMNYALKRSDSALAAAITELRLINAMKKM